MLQIRVSVISLLIRGPESNRVGTSWNPDEVLGVLDIRQFSLAAQVVATVLHAKSVWTPT
jgi:hypothetical protein